MTRRTPAQYNWAELEFDETILTKHFSKRSSKTVKYVVVHHMTIVGNGGGSALTACYNVWQTRKASAHYGVDGKLVRRYVWDKDYAWATGSTAGNENGISIEHANSTAGPKWLVSSDTWKTGARLAAHLHKTYKLGRPVSGKTLRKHSDFTSTACPGPYLGGSQWAAYVAYAQLVYDEITKTKPPVVVPPVVPPVVNPKSYKVVAGDTLGKIATRFKVAVANLVKWNRIGNPNEIHVGQVLTLVAPPTDPKPPANTKLNILHWNIAGSDDTNGYAAANSYRGDEVGRYAKKIGFDVFLTCEAGQTNLRAGVSKGLGLTSWMQRAKAIWFNPATTKNIKARKAYSDNLFAYLSTLKWGAAFFGEKGGIKFSVLEIHTDYRKPAKQAKQVQTIFKKWRKDTDALGIKHTNCFVVGDFNWDGSAGDDPFKALAAWNFEEKGSRTKFTFMERKHLDGVLAHEDADVKVTVESRSDGNMRLSDHNPVKAVVALK